MIENLTSPNNLLFVFNVLRDLDFKKRICAVYSACKFQYFISIGNHEYFEKAEPENSASAIYIFYKSKSFFLQGRYDEALELIKQFNHSNSTHNEGVYLQCDILRALQEERCAWDLLKKHSLASKRNKTLINLSNIVINKIDYFDFSEIIKKSDLNYSFSEVQKCGWLSNAAFRAGLPEEALKLWHKCYIEKQKPFSPKKKYSFINKIAKFVNSIYFKPLAEQALIDFHVVMTKADIRFFLISGTLLGLIRENSLLKHDKDIDIGVFANEINQHSLTEQISKSGFFYKAPARSKNLLKFKHVNGTEIDVFFHTQERDSYWHEGVKLRWHNTPFDLKKTNFLGYSFLIPENFDLYLKENYGNWKDPVHQFDCALDTPNAQIHNKYETAAYGYACILRNKGRTNEYLNLIEKTQLI